MKKIVVYFICVVFLFSFFSVHTFSLFDDYINETVEIISENTGIDNLSIEKLKNLTLPEIFKYMMKVVKNNFYAPFKTFVFTYCISMLCCVLNGVITKDGEGKIKILYSVVFSVIFVNFSNSVKITVECIKNTVNFVNLQIPVFASILTVGGKPTTAISFTAGVYSVIQVISLIINKLFIPLICGCLCICTVSEFNIFSSKDGLLSFIKKTVVLLLSFVGTLLSAFMNVKNVLSSNADGVAYKGLKFLIGNAVPVIGSAVSDALNSVLGSLKLSGNTFAVLFTVAVCVINLSSLVNIVFWKLSFYLCGYISRLFGVGTDVFSQMGEICDIIIAVIVFSVVVLIISVGIVMSVR